MNLVEWVATAVAFFALGFAMPRRQPNRLTARKTVNDAIGAYIAMGFSRKQAQELCRVQHAEVLKKAGVWEAT